MKHLKNNQGLTLIEILATITILFILGGMVYAMLFQMFANFSSAENRSTARQEANTIIAHLTTIHQKSSKYTIEYDPDNENFFTTIYEINGTEHTMQLLGHKNYEYKLRVAGQSLSETDPVRIEPIKQNKVEVVLKLSNAHDEFEVATTISRIEVEESKEED